MIMKKLFLAALCFSGLFATAQLSVKTLEGAVITNGQVFTYNSLEEPDNYLGFKVYNTSATQSIKVRAKVMSITNSTGTDLQLCLGDICLNTITAGSYYPSSAVTIPANGQNSNFDHILNNNAGIDSSQPVEYVIKITQVDNSNVEIGTPVTFTYRYVGLLANTNFDALASAGVQIKSSVIQNQLELRSTQNVQIELFDMTGKRVNFQNANAGEITVDTSNLNAGVYIANFKNASGQTASAKLIKK